MSPPSWSTSFPPSVASPRSNTSAFLSSLRWYPQLCPSHFSFSILQNRFSSPHRFLGEKNSTCQSRAMPNCRQNLDFLCLDLICQYLYPELQQVNAVFINKGMVLPFKSGGINVCTWNPNIHAHGVSQQLSTTDSTHDLPPTHPMTYTVRSQHWVMVNLGCSAGVAERRVGGGSKARTRVCPTFVKSVK